jgi:maleate cis-trans isomerase
MSGRAIYEAPDAAAMARFRPIVSSAIRSAPVVHRLEQGLGIPVVTSNRSMAWHLLASSGISGAAAGFGRLFDVDR